MVGFASREYNRNDSPGTRIGLAERGISCKQNQPSRADLVAEPSHEMNANINVWSSSLFCDVPEENVQRHGVTAFRLPAL